eukprot:483867-Prymnesium_polylepis.1
MAPHANNVSRGAPLSHRGGREPVRKSLGQKEAGSSTEAHSPKHSHRVHHPTSKKKKKGRASKPESEEGNNTATAASQSNASLEPVVEQSPSASDRSVLRSADGSTRTSAVAGPLLQSSDDTSTALTSAADGTSAAPSSSAATSGAPGRKPVILIDMDNTICDFDGSITLPLCHTCR